MTDEPGGSALARVRTNVFLPILGLVLAVSLWWLATVAFHIDPFYVPSPPDVVNAFRQTPKYLLSESWVTIWRVLIGFVIAVSAGLVIAIVLAASQTVERMTMPVLAAVNAIPKVALAPLLLVWFGFGDTPKIVMVVLVSFFPVIVSTMAGLS
jgi:NitT/TauT family transport system permease protein